jgi:FtsP/CotA-like multicopper oxidase with cupredoxin domain
MFRRCFVPLMLIPIFAGCPGEPEAPAGFPEIQGLTIWEDTDPADDVVEYTLNVEKEDMEPVDGQSTRMWTYSKLSPGPLLQANVGDLVRVHVTNQLDEATTVHWHGMRIPAAMDGVVAGGLLAMASGSRC